MAGAEIFSKRNPLDLVLFCGSPGAGKSTFYWNHLQPLGYERVNQDILKTVSLIMLPRMPIIVLSKVVVISEIDAFSWPPSTFARAGPWPSVRRFPVRARSPPPLTLEGPDNTNAEPEIRAKWVDLARKYKIPIRCVWFTASTDLCRHNSAVRALYGGKVRTVVIIFIVISPSSVLSWGACRPPRGRG